MRCPTCGYTNLPKEMYCKQCGMSLPKAPRSKLPLVIIISFLIFTAIGTGVAYYFGVLNNDPKYVSYDKLELNDIAGRWKLDDGEMTTKLPRSITIKKNKVTYEMDGENFSFTVDKRIIYEQSKMVAFYNKDNDEGIAVALMKLKLKGVDRVELFLAGNNDKDAFGSYIREGK
ncbi:hypothetical protein [Ligilactobacillus murinus]|uniref:Uncharacterized protein n=3 Tax=Ligilactobacillus murinus TaxID=1622 RepID=A0AAE6WE30_9LACO|nr:hypothetical protein [Ligilactobacillus murinus]NEF83626.1 hypothetical protein [Ligilactobacillus murinus]NEF85688.1 hypothetical protein [Ligilactobacillus murinus]NEF88203.1 hypothetical protein [Ligilactobacillus murinus]NEF90478.1 hypothetical protein [Ligilactobacillus murinus]NEF92734.1 hypothetical protein [Ligilactobacillus murinus]